MGGFRAEIAGHRFVILGGDPDPDLALIATALLMVEGAGDSVKSLRRAMSQGLADPHRRPVGGNLTEVVITAP